MSLSTDKVTRADVEAAEHAFSFKSLYVGRGGSQHLRYQADDSPDILDRPDHCATHDITAQYQPLE